MVCQNITKDSIFLHQDCRERVPYVPLNVFVQEASLFLILAFLNQKWNKQQN